MSELPEEAAVLLDAIDAPHTLRLHLTLVHEVACALLHAIAHAAPDLSLDADAVRFGAATHDIGKALHPSELHSPGHAHEEAGYAWLRARHVPEHLACFARTHGLTKRIPETVVGAEELVVSLADNLWRGARRRDLEERTIRALAALGARDFWDLYPPLDAAFERLAAQGDARLARTQQAPAGSDP